MKASCEVVIERDALLTALTSEGPVRHLVDPDFLLVAPGPIGITVWTAALNADLQAAGAWNHMIVVSRSSVVAILSRNKHPTIRLTFAGATLVIDRTLITVDDAEPARSFSSRRSQQSRPIQQRTLFPMVSVENALRARCPQLPARGLPLFTD
jgi:hypothetical protein